MSLEARYDDRRIGEDRREEMREERREACRRLKYAEVAIQAMHDHHKMLATQMAQLVLAQDRQTQAMERLANELPSMMRDGTAAGFREIVNDNELMQHAGRGLLSALSDIGTKATGTAVVGWIKGALKRMLPIGLLLVVAYAVGGGALLSKVAAWYVKTFGAGA